MIKADVRIFIPAPRVNPTVGLPQCWIILDRLKEAEILLDWRMNNLIFCQDIILLIQLRVDPT
jgi:hypothetical protein